MIKIIVTNKIWIPLKLVDMKRIKANYVIRKYEDKACLKCDNYGERHSYICDTCAAYTGKYVLYEKKKIGKKEYIGINTGEMHLLNKKVGLHSKYLDDKYWDDQRVIPSMKKYRIKFTGKLREYQVDGLKQWLKAKYGQLEAPPRSGKTIMAVRLTLKLKTRTLILADQGDLLEQMLDSFYEFTDIKDVEFEHKKQLIGIAKNEKDLKRWPIVLSTYQKFISKNGKKRLEKISKRFGLVITDECHACAATCFSRVLSAFEAMYRCGLTATPKRKDRLEFITENIIGPVTAKIKTDQVIPKVFVHETGTKPAREYKLWTYAMQFLARDKARMEMIARQVVKDVRK